MAINPSKLLGSESYISTKTSGQVVIPKKDLLVVKNQVIEIKNLIKTTTLLKQVEATQQRKEIEQEKFKKREGELERKKGPGTEKIKVPGLPKLGFLEGLKNFIFTVLLGRFIVKMLPQVSKFKDVVKNIASGIEFATDFAGRLLDALATFVDKGYKAYDATRGFLKTVGGDNTLKLFDKFTAAIDATIIAAIALASMDRGSGPEPRDGSRTRRPSRSRVTEGRGGRPVRPGGARVTGTTSGGPRVRVPRGISAKGGGLLGLLFLIPDLIESGMLISQGRGKDGLRTLLSAVTGTLAGIGAYSATIAGAAALGITGVGLPAAIGLAIAGFAASALAGTAAYNLSNEGLKKMGLVDIDPNTNKPYQYAGGGSVTRGGRFITGPTRRITKKPTRVVSVRVSNLKPGADVGGKNKIEKVFPSPDPNSRDKDKQVNPLGYIQSSYKKMTSSKSFGALMALPIKTLAGQKPTQLDYRIAAQGLNFWLSNTFSSDVKRGGVAGFAGGGEVNAASFLSGEDMTNVITKSLQDGISSQLENALRDLKKQLGLKPREVEKKDITQPSPGEELGNATEMVGGARLLMNAGFPSLSSAILSSVIQAESTWQGQRTPWVLNDGAGTNKGLISWNRERITNAEKFLGKPLESASNSEQIRWIKEELKQYGLLDELMNPQATEEQIKQAIYAYVRWDRRYDADHWENISRIRSALERGEQGSYVSGRTTTLGNQSGNLSVARQLAESMGLQLTSHYRSGDPGYHGQGRAMDFQTVGAPGNRGTPSQMRFAQAMISQYGSSLKQLIYTPLGFSISDGKQVEPMAAAGHYDHVHVAFFGGGPTGKGGLTMTHPGEYIIDKDSVDAFGINFFDILNKVENMSQRQQAAKQLMNILQFYAGYESGGRQRIKVRIPATQTTVVPVPVPVGGGMMVAGGSSGTRPQDITYRG